MPVGCRACSGWALAAIRSARTSITFETCIYCSGDIGHQFADALAERARQGVKVHVLPDRMGSPKMDDSLLASMAGAGVAPQWTGNARDPAHWRDTHFEVQGPVVAQMQSVFSIDLWLLRASATMAEYRPARL